MENEIITLAHGSGGNASLKLINNYIKKYFSNKVLNKMEDAAVLDLKAKKIAMTTDSFVISPIFFAGGDIGRLSICGTVNDLAAMGARPIYITVGLILEEGLLLKDLEKIIISMKKTADEAGVIIVAGDTKVVNRGKADKIFINTTGIGKIISNKNEISSSNAKSGDSLIITGSIGDHEVAILKEREGLELKVKICSDTAPLNKIIEKLLKNKVWIDAMRDPTRGGLATIMNEIALSSGVDIEIDESKVPIKATVVSVCDILGFDPFYLANEGKMLIICHKSHEKKALKLLRSTKYGRNAQIIGRVTEKSSKPQVVLKTRIGGERILFITEGEQLPRIC